MPSALRTRTHSMQDPAVSFETSFLEKASHPVNFVLLISVLVLAFLSNSFVNVPAILRDPLFYTGYDIFAHVYYASHILTTHKITELYRYSKGLAVLVAALAELTSLPTPLLY
ncbi:MAG: hypothetical protein ACTSVM_06985, partial [Candidatus Ranarchaeia archaeon]